MKNKSASSRNRLRFKTSTNAHMKGEDEVERRSRPANLKCCEVLDDDDELFFSASGYVRRSNEFHTSDDLEFLERLHDAMADDEGATYWSDYYSGPIHEFTRPHDGMSDAQYAKYVREGMWRRKHGSRYHHYASASRQSSSCKSCKERPPAKTTASDLQARWTAYLNAWSTVSSCRWEFDTVPWPNVSGRGSDLSLASIKQFLNFSGDIKVIAKQELRRRWHPDKFMQKTGLHVVTSQDKSLLSYVTSVAQILNEICSGPV